ncbi:MAG: tRNA (adenosine(37)-N6)-threonylcarbamoyltransferase complex ATPase subunit type 1 TsaE [Ruminococcaceae bacterium]|nr:tRNA (adenosine(37)-N6)-threonylcarbamoyltransferase complex ATPase subunit type 1 TsaE [Oscillospiraceae bacterium]
MKQEFISHSTSETEEIASNFAKQLEKSDFVALFGDLGVGKTAFVRGMASTICPGASVKSPTYTIVNEYRTPNGELFHFDVYRIEDDDDLYSMGFYDYLKKGTCVCEWSENIPYAIPENAYRVTIERVPESTEHRRIIIERN